jgi:hypothetical protein
MTGILVLVFLVVVGPLAVYFGADSRLPTTAVPSKTA